MKVFPYIISLIASGLVATLLALPISLIAYWIHAKLYNEMPGFWTGFWLGGINSLIIVIFSEWVFSWFDFSLPILFIILITLFVTINNYNRYVTRPNKKIESGYLIGYAFGIPAIYYQSFFEKGTNLFL